MMPRTVAITGCRLIRNHIGPVMHEMRMQAPHHHHLELPWFGDDVLLDLGKRGIQHAGDVVHGFGMNVLDLAGAHIIVITTTPGTFQVDLVIKGGDPHAE